MINNSYNVIVDRADIPAQTIVVEGVRQATEQILARASGQQTERQTATKPAGGDA